MILKTNRLILRPWKKSDAKNLYEYASSPEIGPAAGWQPHTSVKESRQIIKDVLSAPETYAVVDKATLQPIGSIGLMIGDASNIGLPQNEAEIGYWIAAPYWGKGLIPEATREILRRAFEDLELKQVWCGYFEGNVKSKRVQEKCGFKYNRTVEHFPVKALGEEKTLHVTRFTKEEWQADEKELKIPTYERTDNMEKVIEIEHLSKSYGDVKAVQDISFQVRRGELFAFLGVNGAGKSTTISMICGQLKKDSGSITVCGEDIEKSFNALSRRIGVVFQSSALDNQLSALDNLRNRAALYGITGGDFKRRFSELAKILDFEDFSGRPLSKLSGGQKRRIDIARALIHEPEILILDEPTTGLDPQTRKLLWDIIEKFRKEKKMTVFLTTHYMEEAADADYVIILDSGKIVAEGTPLQLKNKYVGDYITLYGCNETELNKLALPYEKLSGAARIQVGSTAEVTKLITSHPEIFTDYEVIKGKMDDVFLAVTGKNLPGGAAK